MGGGRSAPRPGRFTPGKDPVPIEQEAGCAPGPVLTGAENLDPTGIRSPDRPVRSESLYRLLKYNWSAHNLKLIWPSSTGLDVVYGPFIPRMLPASVHRTIMNAFEGITDLKPSPSGAVVEVLNRSVMEGLLGFLIEIIANWLRFKLTLFGSRNLDFIKWHWHWYNVRVFPYLILLSIKSLLFLLGL